jgi:Ca2+-transporting ATPase
VSALKTGGQTVPQTPESQAFHALGVDEVLRLLGSNRSGLAKEEARERLTRFGRNELAGKRRVTALQILLRQFKDIFVVMLIAASLISAVLGEVVDASTIGAILLLMAVIGFVQDYRGERALEAMKKMAASTARVLRGSQEEMIPAAEVVPGDILMLEEGDRVAADARIVETIELRTLEATLTGESTPVEKSLKPIEVNTPVADKRNMVFSGTYVAYGRGRAVATATGTGTEFGKIAEQIQEAEEARTPLQEKMDRFSKGIAKIVVAASVAIFVLGLMRVDSGRLQSAVAESLITAVSLAISAVPEGIPAITAVTLALGARALMRRNAIIRKLSSTETLGAVTVICSDKTGTLTKGEMTVRRIFVDGRFIEVSGTGYDGEGEFRWIGYPEAPKSDEALKIVLRIGALCNNAGIEPGGEGGTRIYGDPTEGALVVAAKKAGLNKNEMEDETPRVKEIPFSSERRIMTTVHKLAEGEYVAYVKGAPEAVLERSSHTYSGGEERPLTDTERERIISVNEEMASDALRVLAMAYRKLNDLNKSAEEIEGDLVFAGLQGMIDPPRPEAIEAHQRCEKAGIKVVMITGDHKHTAAAIAREIGIFREGDLVLTGSQLESMGEPGFNEVVECVSVYARVSPEHKQKIIRALKAKGHVVAMTGDGVNDAPAIKKADIGIAMGITGTDVTKEASHMVLSDDNFATIVSAVEYGRAIFDNIRKYTRFLISANFDELFLLAGFTLLGLPLPMLPSMILWINLATDGGPAIALSMDRPERDVMSRPPRNPREGILQGMISFIFVAFSFQVLGSVAVFAFHTWPYLSAGLPIPEVVLAKARTAVFVQSVLYELYIVWNCRSEKRSLWRLNPLGNKYLMLTALIALLATTMLLYVPPLQAAFHVVPLSLSDWAILAVAASPGLFAVPEFFYGRKIWRWR